MVTPNSIEWIAVPAGRENPSRSPTLRTLALAVRPGIWIRSTKARPVANWTMPSRPSIPASRPTRRSSTSSRSLEGMPSDATRMTPVQATRLIIPESIDRCSTPAIGLDAPTT